MRVQRVLVPGVVEESWTVVGEDFAVIAPVEEFLAHLSVVGRSPGTVRAYAFDLRESPRRVRGLGFVRQAAPAWR